MKIAVALAMMTLAPTVYSWNARESSYAPLPAAPTKHSSRVRVALAAMLGVRSGSPELVLKRFDQAFYNDVEFVVGEAPGEHEHVRVIVAVLPDRTVLPLGCAASRLVLQAVVPPRVVSDSGAEYVTLLAMLDGEVPPLARHIRDASEIPTWARGLASERGIRVEPPRVQKVAPQEHRITLFAWADGLYRIVGVLGAGHAEDGIISATLLVARPPN